MNRSYHQPIRVSRSRVGFSKKSLSQVRTERLIAGENSGRGMLESELFALLEHTADAAYTVTDAGEICSWNSAAEHLFGYAAKEVLQRNIDEVLDARDTLGTSALAGGSEATTRTWDETSGGVANFDLLVKTRSAGRIWVNLSTIVFNNPRTRRRLFIRLAHNVDQRHRNEELLHRALEGAHQLIALSEDASEHAPVAPLSDRSAGFLPSLPKAATPRP
jgi:PAS domain S-box-containing protein